MAIGITEKRNLSALLAEGHRAFGKVKPRREYKEDEDKGGGAGTAEHLFESHPLLAQQPMGASSDLTFLTTENSNSEQAAEQREDQASPQLRQQLQAALAAKQSCRSTPTPRAN